MSSQRERWEAIILEHAGQLEEQQKRQQQWRFKRAIQLIAAYRDIDRLRRYINAEVQVWDDSHARLLRRQAELREIELRDEQSQTLQQVNASLRMQAYRERLKLYAAGTQIHLVADDYGTRVFTRERLGQWKLQKPPPNQVRGNKADFVIIDEAQRLSTPDAK